MPSDIQLYDTMAEFYAAIGGTMEQEAEFTAHRMEVIHAEAPYTSPLFRTNYYSIVLVRRGRGRYLINEEAYATQPGTIYFTNPGHIKGFEIDEPMTGFVITFAESFLKHYVHAAIFDEFPFLIAEVAPPKYLARDPFQSFDALGEQIVQEYEGQAAYKFKVLGSLMVVLLLRIKEAFWDAYDPLEEADAGSLIVRTFRRNLEARFRALHAGTAAQIPQVQELAEAQQLHPGYLSTVIKHKTGKSVHAWIAEKAVAEAQALLARSRTSVKEVAYRLGFSEPGHFSRFFKKHTGLTPTAFRAQR
ncbi:MAG: AraC family transcriptional regulator [Bacteroidota bacterium]